MSMAWDPPINFVERAGASSAHSRPAEPASPRMSIQDEEERLTDCLISPIFRGTAGRVSLIIESDHAITAAEWPILQEDFLLELTSMCHARNERRVKG